MQRRVAIAAALWRRRWLLAGLAGLLTLAALPPLAALRVSNSLAIWYPAGDPVLADYARFVERYGSDELVVIAVSDAAGFEDAESVDRISSLTDELFGVDGIADVVSLTTVPAGLDAVRERLLSDDGRTTALLLRMQAGPELEQQRHAILLRVGELVGASGLPARFAGFGVLYDTLNQASTGGAVALVAGAHVTMLVLLALFFRRALPTAATLLAVAIAATWTMGAYAALGQQLNMVTMVLPTLVLVIGIADCMHLLRSAAQGAAGPDREAGIIHGIAHALGPCLLTSTTTAAGFLALTVTDLPIVRGLGLFGAVGAVAAFVSAIAVVLPALSFRAAEPALTGRLSGRLPRLAGRLAARRPRTVVAAFVVLGILSALGIARLRVDTYSIGYLADDHPVRRDSASIESTLGAYASVDFVVRAGDVCDPANLAALAAWQAAAADLPDVDWSWSVLDLAGGRANGKPAGGMDAALARLAVLAPDVLHTVLTGRDEMRVSFGAPMLSAVAVGRLVDRLEAVAAFPDGVEVRPAGYAAVYTRIVERLVTSQLTGFGGSFLLVFGSLAVAFRSLRRLLLAIPANLAPVAMTLGIMGWGGIPLDIATVTIASVLLGLVVDDTVHLLWPRGIDGLAPSIDDALERSGGSLLMTSLVLAGGLLVLGFADLLSVAWFGLLAAAAIVLALLTDLTLLPAMAVLATPARNDRPARLGTLSSH